MKVELLHFEGCPSYQRLLPRLRELVAQVDPSAEVELRRIETIEEAERQRFLGSPSVRVDGEDVDPGAEKRGDFGVKCRLYKTGDALGPLPPDSWISEALTRARGRARGSTTKCLRSSSPGASWTRSGAPPLSR